MIKVENIYKNFGNLQVLKGVNLQVEKGEMVAIVGKSGTGKTTLLQIIGTLEKPTKGEVIIDGVQVSQLSEKRLAKFRNEHIGFIFQLHQLLPEFTALENVMMPALIARKNEKQAKEEARKLLINLGLGERLNHKPQELSGGERQRVAAARAIMMHPTLILADEPTGSLDSENKRELQDLLLQLKNKFEQTLIIVTHDIELAQIADRIIEIKDGQVSE